MSAWHSHSQEVAQTEGSKKIEIDKMNFIDSLEFLPFK